MSYVRTVSYFSQKYYDYKDDEFQGWSSKLRKEFQEFCIELNSSFDCRLDSEKLEEYLSLRMKLESCFTDLDKLLISKTGLTLDKDTIYLIKTKLKNFNEGLESLEGFIKKEMYSNRLEYFILKLKSILLSIVNCFYGRDLQYSRTKVYGMDHFYIIDETGGPATHFTPRYILPERPKISLFFSQQLLNNLDEKGKVLLFLFLNRRDRESIAKAMSSRRARDRRASLGEAGNASLRKVMV